jgi:hypothetical protein
MNHPTSDELLLLAYDELPRDAAAPLEAHVASCVECGRELQRLTTARAALDVAVVTPRRRLRWIPLALAAAAMLGGILIFTAKEPAPVPNGWPYHREWSAHAGYFAGGRAVIDIDSQLTRLEQGWTYGRP